MPPCTRPRQPAATRWPSTAVDATSKTGLRNPGPGCAAWRAALLTSGLPTGRREGLPAGLVEEPVCLTVLTRPALSGPSNDEPPLTCRFVAKKSDARTCVPPLAPPDRPSRL